MYELIELMGYAVWGFMVLIFGAGLDGPDYAICFAGLVVCVATSVLVTGVKIFLNYKRRQACMARVNKKKEKTVIDINRLYEDALCNKGTIMIYKSERG